MKNPLVKRLSRELKGDFSRYLIIFLFITGTIALVSRWSFARNNMSTAYNESFEEYNIEDRNFVFYKITYIVK